MLIVKKGYDFSKWLLHHTGKFPKSHRFSIALKLENGILDFLESAVTANMRKEKLPLLRKADEALARLRLLFRLSFEMEFINIKSYEFGSSQINELGKLLGGWIKNPHGAK
ncbi:MAG: diversity-generating retroelement protein Avd [Candidatus Aminicenantes bacterium]|nr:diversity-generating retroelement protein Avd [Candidatus Aminicenantes bacterium]